MRHRPAPDHPWRRFWLFKKGVLEMAIPRKQMDVERMMNLIRAFGWELEKQEMADLKTTVTVSKIYTPEAAAAGGSPSPGPG